MDWDKLEGMASVEEEGEEPTESKKPSSTMDPELLMLAKKRPSSFNKMPNIGRGLTTCTATRSRCRGWTAWLLLAGVLA